MKVLLSQRVWGRKIEPEWQTLIFSEFSLQSYLESGRKLQLAEISRKNIQKSIADAGLLCLASWHRESLVKLLRCRKFRRNSQGRHQPGHLSKAPFRHCVKLRCYRCDILCRGLPSGGLNHSHKKVRVACLQNEIAHEKLLNRPTCFHASFFPFCPFCWPPLFLPFLSTFSPFLSSRKVLYSVEQKTAQSLERGSFRMDASKKFGKEIPSRNCAKKGSKRFENAKKDPKNDPKRDRKMFSPSQAA